VPRWPPSEPPSHVAICSVERVSDFANQIHAVVDQLHRDQRQQLMRLLIEDVHVSGSHVQIQLRIRPNQAAPEAQRPATTMKQRPFAFPP
jgi:hypothetical protein